MPHPPRLLFILTDGAHARFVVRKAKTGSFVTLHEVDGAERLRTLRRELRSGPPARNQESASPARHRVGREDYFRQAKEAFVGDVAALVPRFEAEAADGVVLVAPARLVAPLRKQLGRRAKVAGVLVKNLVKTPDAELGGWLASLAVRSVLQPS